MKILLSLALIAAGTLNGAYGVQIRPAVDANTKTGNAVINYGAKMNFFVVDGPHDGDVYLRVFAGTRQELLRTARGFGQNCARMPSSLFHGWWSGNSRLTFGSRFQQWPFSAEPESSWVFIFEVVPGARPASRYAGYVGDQVVELKQDEAEAYFGSGLQVRMINTNPVPVRYSSSRTNTIPVPTLNVATCALLRKVLGEPILVGTDLPNVVTTMMAADRKRKEAVANRIR